MRRILLIGTDPEVSVGLRTSPALEDCEFDAAAGEADALRRLRLRSFDAVVTGSRTTVEEDLALLGEMLQVRPGVKTILLAPSATPEQVIAALRARAFACFSAPFQPSEIADMVLRAINEADWRHGIEVITAHRDWISLRVDCRMLTAERLVRFLSELRVDLPGGERESLMLAFREILFNAIEHGARFDPDQVIEVSAIRTARTIVYYVRDPGPGFRADALLHAAVSNPPDDPLAHADRRAREGRRPGGFGLLLARRTVDELIYNEIGNEVLLIKYTR